MTHTRVVQTTGRPGNISLSDDFNSAAPRATGAGQPSLPVSEEMVTLTLIPLHLGQMRGPTVTWNIQGLNFFTRYSNFKHLTTNQEC